MKVLIENEEIKDIRHDPGLRPEKPRIAISSGSMRSNQTGSWRNMRPVHIPLQIAPCTNACPVGVNIPEFLDLLDHGKIQEAWLKVLEANPLPGVCGRVCYHPCEYACNRSDLDSVIANHALERYVADSNIGKGIAQLRPSAIRPERIAVVGSGPAGLACAYHLARQGYQVVLFESESQPGGILRTGIPPYRLPREVLDKEIGDILTLGVQLQTNCFLGENLSWEDLAEFKAVFLATGAHRSRKLGVLGEEIPGVSSALDFLKKVNAGFPPAIGRRVLVVGGGNTAIDASRTALRLGSEVMLLYRRTREEMPAVPEEIEAAIREGVAIRFLVAPVAVNSQDGRITSVEMQRMELGAPDSSGRRAPHAVTGSNFHLEADTVLTAIGEDPDLRFAHEDLPRSGGKIVVDDNQATSTGFLYAGGDAASSAGGTVATALRAGRRAAAAIHQRISGAAPQLLSPYQRVISPEHVRTAYFQPGRQVPLPAREIGTLMGDFEEIHLGLHEIAARQEAARCMRCGFCTGCNNCVIFCPDTSVQFMEGIEGTHQYLIDMQHCKGCGICAEECPRGSILMIEEGRA
jgi:NADPH-dependent glutamate synthase beta subunit-like oxidoreductase